MLIIGFKNEWKTQGFKAISHTKNPMNPIDKPMDSNLMNPIVWLLIIWGWKPEPMDFDLGG